MDTVYTQTSPPSPDPIPSVPSSAPFFTPAGVLLGYRYPSSSPDERYAFESQRTSGKGKRLQNIQRPNSGVPSARAQYAPVFFERTEHEKDTIRSALYDTDDITVESSSVDVNWATDPPQKGTYVLHDRAGKGIVHNSEVLVN